MTNKELEQELMQLSDEEQFKAFDELGIDKCCSLISYLKAKEVKEVKELKKELREQIDSLN